MRKGEKGLAFVMVLIFLVLGSLTITPILTYMVTGLQSGQTYEVETEELYAADAGIEDARWQINRDQMEILFTSPVYDDYDYATTWNYSLAEPVNERNVNVSIDNIWIPQDIAVPAPTAARDIIEAGKLVVTGNIPAASTYQIQVAYYPGSGESLAVETLGVWLPPGFSYVVDSSNLEADPGDDFYAVPVVSPHQGGQAVLWSFSSLPFTDMPGVVIGDTPLTTSVTVQFSTSMAGRQPEAVAWITTSGVGDIPYSWDADRQVYAMTSVADDTTVEAYTIKSEVRKLGSMVTGDYKAIGNSLMTASGDPRWRDTLLDESDAQVSDIPADAEVDAAYLYWSAWISGELTDGDVVYFNGCDSYDIWINGNRWTIFADDEFRGHGGGPDAERYLTLANSVDLSEYVGQVVTIMWDKREYGSLESDDYLYFAFSADGGTTWGDNIEAFHNDIGDEQQAFFCEIPEEYKTTEFKVRFYCDFSSSNEYCYLDNVTVSQVIWYDDCGNYIGWDNGSQWSIYDNKQFAGRGGGTSAQRTLTLSESIDLSAYLGKTIKITWQQREDGWLESSDYLYFAVSGDGGDTWSDNIEAIHDDIGTDPQDFRYTVPQEYLTAEFKFRFYLDFNSSNEWAYIDNISIFESTGVALSDNTVIFKINGQQVYLDESGDPQQGNVELTAADWSTLENQPGTYSYACYLDVTSLVQEYSDEGDNENNTGNGTYTVGGVYGDTDDEWSYAGWSLVIIYSSSETDGHQLYLYDDFVYSGMDQNVDFDRDGTPGGSISGFIVPQPVAGEVNAARLTCFVGEGDDYYNGDSLVFEGTPLSDGQTDSDVWNSWSQGLSEDGVDIDTFYIRWADDLLQPGDTSAQIDLPTENDSWNLVYIIISFRSEVTTGGTLTYLIRG